ncbi:hypothetical protein ACQPYK_20325 [Streptosporangium sp. CA-135522]|uniref:hypothetical protein n=1 Tax=Streptosporangium sp. CA-135522 TaxID=3240072 RepID=UPI003D8C0F28
MSTVTWSAADTAIPDRAHDNSAQALAASDEVGKSGYSAALTVAARPTSEQAIRTTPGPQTCTNPIREPLNDEIPPDRDDQTGSRRLQSGRFKNGPAR